MYLNKLFDMRGLRLLYLILTFASIGISGCQKDDATEEESFAPFDASKPVVISDFTPKEGGSGQRLIIYGNNFGTDPALVSVFVGGKQAVVISVKGESIYCLVPERAFKGDVQVRVGNIDKQVIAFADTDFDYERKMVVSNLIGYKNDRGDEPWRDGKFEADNLNNRASGFSKPSFMKFDPLNSKHLWTVFDENNGLYLFDLEDSTVTKKRSDLDRPRSIDFTNDGKFMIIAEDRGGENDGATSRLSRAQDWQDKEVLTRYRQCNGAVVHPVNGEMYFNSFEKGQFFRFDLPKYFSEGLGVKDFEQLFVVQGNAWNYNITIHPSGTYAYIIVINKQYILRIDYNQEKKQFNQPYLVCGKLGSEGYQDGVGSSVLLNFPYQGVFVKNEKYVEAGKTDEYDFYFTEIFNHDIRTLTPEGSVTTFAGRGSSSINSNPFGYVNGDLREEARFDRPTGLAYDEEEKAFYIGDQENHRIRKIALEKEEE